MLLEPNFKSVVDKANELLLQSETINNFPFSAYQFTYEMSEAEIRKYSTIGTNELPAEIILGSKDAALVENEGRYLLFYNEAMKRERIRFSVIHENGHYHLAHDMSVLTAKRRDGDPTVKNLYSKYEIEANFFAAQLLMPEQILIELSRRGKKITPDFLQNAFGVSEEAARKRIDTLKKAYNWQSFKTKSNAINLDDCILLKFKSFIDNLAPRRMSYIDEFEKEYELEMERQTWM